MSARIPTPLERFHEISEAYEVLTDKEKRQAYDRFGHAGVGAGPSVGAAGSGFGGQGSKVWSTSEGFGGPIPSDFSDLFEQMFSGAESPFRTRPAPRPERQGQDVATDVAVGFLTAALGGTEEVSIRGPLGPQRISVKIPPGIESGAKLRVKGKGGQGAPGAAAGDLIVTITVGEHPLFSRQGLDILIDVPITLAEAGLGATVNVPLLKGSVEIKVPAGDFQWTEAAREGEGHHRCQGSPGRLSRGHPDRRAGGTLRPRSCPSAGAGRRVAKPQEEWTMAGDVSRSVAMCGGSGRGDMVGSEVEATC